MNSAYSFEQMLKDSLSIIGYFSEYIFNFYMK